LCNFLAASCYPVADGLVSLGLAVPIHLRQDAGEFLLLAAQPLDGVGKFGKRLPRLAFEFMPLAFEHILVNVHVSLSCLHDASPSPSTPFEKVNRV